MAVYKSKSPYVLVNVTECGKNALEVLVELSKHFDLSVYLGGLVTLPTINSCIIDGELVHESIEVSKQCH